jgi:hypothetical protein
VTRKWEGKNGKLQMVKWISNKPQKLNSGQAEDSFGANDEDWAVYRKIVGASAVPS